MEKKIKRLIRFILDRKKSYEISLKIVTDSEIKILNYETRDKDKPTDVLSYPLFEKNLSIPHAALGEIIISLDTLKRQAREIGHTEKDEFHRLLVHGFLHLIGYDHETNEEDARIMQEKEEECLALIENL
ncbi:MAG: rRNA maturation RNase YbeY [Leptospiraceae bacterium]|nr:rRNA maturation RNase YbeY [Leptospiraceae bacterium]